MTQVVVTGVWQRLGH